MKHLQDILEWIGDIAVWLIITILIIVLAVTMTTCGGCNGAPLVGVKPEAKVAPTITAGDIKELKQDIKQIQNTVTTTNFALDKERAKVEKDRVRKYQVSSLSMNGVLVGLIILGLIAPSFLPKRYHFLGYVAALGIIVGSIALPMLWPF